MRFPSALIIQREFTLMASSPENLSMAVFCDFENVALGVRDANYEKFDIKPILERLLLKGSIVVKKAYCDWDRYKSFKGTMHEANFELIEIPHVRQSGKNSADIRLVVDALDLCYTKAHVNTFVIISGDSDFSPLVSKLRENAKQVIGVGVKQSTSDLLVANCDEFIFYDDLVRESRRTAAKRDARESPAAATKRSPDEEVRRKEKYESRKTEAIEMAVETFDALVSERGDSGKIWASMLKEAIKRRKPDFSESYYGFRTFGNLLEEAQTRGLLEFGRDEKSGAYVYRSSGLVAVPAAANADAASETIAGGETAMTAEEGNNREGGNRRDSRRNGRGGRKQNEHRRGEAPQAFVPVAEAESAVVEQYAPASQPEVVHEVSDAVEAVAEEGNAKRGSRRNGRGGRKNGDGARDARTEAVEAAPTPEPVVAPVAEVVAETVAEAKPKAKPRTPARKTAAAKKPAKKAVDAVLDAAPVAEAAPVEVAVVAEDKPAKAPRKTPARRPARKKAEAA